MIRKLSFLCVLICGRKDLDQMLVAGFQKYVPVQNFFETDEALKDVAAELAGEIAFNDETEQMASEEEFEQAGSFQVTDNEEEV